MKQTQIKVFMFYIFVFSLRSQELDLMKVLELSFEHLDIRNGLQLESIIVISDKEGELCQNSNYSNFYNFDCSKIIQDALSGLSDVRFVSNIFIFTQFSTENTGNSIQKLWSNRFNSKWNEEFSALQSQIYVLTLKNNSTIILSELYKPCFKRNMVERNMVTFSNDQVQVQNIESIWERRKDMSRCDLRVTYINTIHFHEIVNKSDLKLWEEDGNYVSTVNDPKVVVKGNGKSFSGLDRQVFNALYCTLNFSITWVHSKDNKFGAYDPLTKKWNGLVEVLANNKADMSVCWLTVTQLRGQLVSYAESLYYGSYKLYSKKPEPTISWSTYVDVFSLNYWITLIFICFVISMILLLIILVTDNYKNHTKVNRPKMYIHKILTALAATLLGVGTQDVYLAHNVSTQSFKSIRMIFWLLVPLE